MARTVDVVVNDTLMAVNAEDVSVWTGKGYSLAPSTNEPVIIMTAPADPVEVDAPDVAARLADGYTLPEDDYVMYDPDGAEETVDVADVADKLDDGYHFRQIYPRA
jgi:hypothetical protein